jgi:crooked neck
MPRKVKKRRKLDDDSYEEYMDYLFPADDKHAANFASLVQKAHAWKKAQEAASGASAS